MHDPVFHFRQFDIAQDRCAMKVGTDGVLLGAWVAPRPSVRILDIGTGTGLIALMLAQRFEGSIDAVELDENAFRQAVANFSASPWADRTHGIHDSFQHYSLVSGNLYDLIVSNPPFYMDAFQPPSRARSIARHTGTGLSFADLADGVCRLLRPSGSFSLILPGREGRLFREMALKRNLYLQRLTRVKTKPGGTDKRLLMQYGFEESQVEENEMCVRNGDGGFSAEYIRMTRAYYLGLAGSSAGLKAKTRTRPARF